MILRHCRTVHKYHEQPSVLEDRESQQEEKHSDDRELGHDLTIHRGRRKPPFGRPMAIRYADIFWSHRFGFEEIRRRTAIMIERS
jgi:hypothetical protein